MHWSSCNVLCTCSKYVCTVHTHTRVSIHARTNLLSSLTAAHNPLHHLLELLLAVPLLIWRGSRNKGYCKVCKVDTWMDIPYSGKFFAGENFVWEFSFLEPSVKILSYKYFLLYGTVQINVTFMYIRTSIQWILVKQTQFISPKYGKLMSLVDQLGFY